MFPHCHFNGGKANVFISLTGHEEYVIVIIEYLLTLYVLFHLWILSEANDFRKAHLASNMMHLTNA